MLGSLHRRRRLGGGQALSHCPNPPTSPVDDPEAQERRQNHQPSPSPTPCLDSLSSVGAQPPQPTIGCGSQRPLWCGSSRVLAKDHLREEHPCRRLGQTPGVRESRVRDGAAFWPNPRGRGGVRARGGAISRPGACWRGRYLALRHGVEKKTISKLRRRLTRKQALTCHVSRARP